MMHVTPRLADHRHGVAIFAIARSFLPHFSELDTLDFELDLLPSSSRLLGLTDQDRSIPRVRIRSARPTNPSLTYAIPHELTHLLQLPLRRVPQGERAADLFAMARAGDRFGVAPSYLRVPVPVRDGWSAWRPTAAALAREALERRETGQRAYMAWWEAELRNQCRGRESNPLTTDLQSVTLAALSPRRGVAHPAEGY